MTALADPAILAASVTDPELPMLTLADLGVLRGVAVDGDEVVVTITPTYSGCPALASMRDDLLRVLGAAGFRSRVEIALSPAWSSDDITAHGREVLAAHGISAPAHGIPARGAVVGLSLVPRTRHLTCPLCGHPDAALVSEFGSTACKALYRCTSCGEPFDHIKEL